MGSQDKDHKSDKKKMKKKAKKASGDDHENHEGGKKIIEDPRFASVHWDPRFQKVPKHNSKVAIDSRFNRMFTDKSFASSSAPSDKRGKPKKQNSGASLRHYYRLEEEEEEKRQLEENEEDAFDDINTEVVVESESEELDKLGGGESSESEESEDGGEGGEADSSTDEEDDVEVDYDDETPDVEVENVPLIEDGTRRLAAVNMDWQHVRAADLFVVLRSFLPKGGEILSVAVYPSEFGLQRMKEEEIHGPVALFDDEKERKNEDDDDNEIDYEKLRDYEKSRLRYYYAVVECDSVATSEHLYKACDGLEFERSSNVLDLRFIPDSMEFKHPPRDVATEKPTGYEGLDFQTRALQHSNIPISWDEDEPQRLKTLRRKFTADQLAELELKEFLASEESETDDDGENENMMVDALDRNHGKREKYRALLQSGDGSDGDGEEEGKDMEITFNTGLEEISKRILEKRNKGPESVWEAVLKKTREKKKARKDKSRYSSDDENSNIDEATEQPDDFFIEEAAVKKAKNKNSRAKDDKADQDGDEEAVASRAELELLLADDKGTDDGRKGYNLKPKKAKGKRRGEVPDEEKLPVADFDDPRFSARFTSLFALDPTDPQFKRSAAYARQLARKRHMDDKHELLGNECDKQITSTLSPSVDHQTNANVNVSSDISPPKKEKLELSSLIKSVKTKSKQVQLPSGRKKLKKENKFRT
ncbi:hypothetical protein K2173_006232 [Erythroxylum novogranatense]|uniref:ESF1 RRM domain-containing protein n=1 Tax=Erythroxylum novogranatense TaxID=1862640 RepID=A0AAV8TCM7_9ROSI|nr:hypothetical protein K2173_006232 [Erythroxylum novogranatense]